MKRLTIFDFTGELAQLIQHTNHIEIISVVPDIETDLKRLVTQGISGFVWDNFVRKFKETLPNDPFLMDRINDRMKDYGFSTIIDEV